MEATVYFNLDTKKNKNHKNSLRYQQEKFRIIKIASQTQYHNNFELTRK